MTYAPGTSAASNNILTPTSYDFFFNGYIGSLQYLFHFSMDRTRRIDMEKLVLGELNIHIEEIPIATPRPIKGTHVCMMITREDALFRKVGRDVMGQFTPRSVEPSEAQRRALVGLNLGQTLASCRGEGTDHPTIESPLRRSRIRLLFFELIV